MYLRKKRGFQSPFCCLLIIEWRVWVSLRPNSPHPLLGNSCFCSTCGGPSLAGRTNLSLATPQFCPLQALCPPPSAPHFSLGPLCPLPKWGEHQDWPDHSELADIEILVLENPLWDNREGETSNEPLKEGMARRQYKNTLNNIINGNYNSKTWT